MSERPPIEVVADWQGLEKDGEANCKHNDNTRMVPHRSDVRMICT
jgi:hypothetical protein